jgi:DEAD/DEAH box helicase domain-containing protein
MITEVIFDIETKKLFGEITTDNPADLEVSLVSVYRRTLTDRLEEIAGVMTSFWEADFPKMWPLFRDAKRVVGFNSVKFDAPALAPLAPYPFTKLPHFDIMLSVRETLGRSLSLNHLAENTLGKGKVDSGLNAVEYFKKGDPESLNKLKHYCEQDVFLTRDLYDFGLRTGILKYIDQWNNAKSVTVNFSYPREVVEQSRQIGLF